MNFLQATVLGIVQGLTEFLPISSSGHLRIVPALFGWDDPGAAFTAVIQLGTMAAVVAYFWRDLLDIAVTWARSLARPELRGDLHARMGWYIALGTIPIGIAGIVFEHRIETSARDLRIVASGLIIFGLIMLFAERLGSRRRAFRGVQLRDALLVGGAQALALIPGVSRSGATITAGMFLGFTREAAARFSFLLSIPAVVLSGFYEMGDIGEGSVPIGPTVVATILSFVSGYMSIAWLLRFLASHTMKGFVIYRVAVGGLVLILVASGVLAAT